MRTKKTTSRFAFKLDKVFWFLITFLPVILYAIYLFATRSGNILGLDAFLRLIFNYDYTGGLAENPIFKALYALFSFSPDSAFAILPYSLLYLISYMATIEIVHVAFDVLVFIPRLAHKWISKAVQDD